MLTAILLCVPPKSVAQDAEDERLWLAGAYSFSDELGGFRIVSVTGTGIRDDPIVIIEEFDSATPATLVIRTTRPIRPFDAPVRYANGILYLRIVTKNHGGQGWVEFEFELQELLGKASVFGDGLSFDQRSADKKNISSDSFVEFGRDFEPYDKLLFRNGKVDPLDTAEFGFLITDFTPKRQFYLVQDPRIPSS
ncbi:MAG: hypothetical protein H0T56_14555 [Pseudaminobacter sp.]|nr:hypothetical protein [Pseudaminobacter sp.]